MHVGTRGTSRSTAAPIFGKLENGESYVVYRCLLYSDGFILHKGTQSTYEGLYMQPLCVTADGRRDSSSARTLATIPPGVAVSDVIRHHVVKCVVDGAVRGRRTLDGDGNVVWVFLDVVAVDGDTPGLNALIDVWHTAQSGCSWCSYDWRQETAAHNKYSGHHGTWLRGAWRRTVVRHRAGRLMKAPAAILRSTGVRPTVLPKHTSLYEWRDALLQQRSQVPKTSEGTPVVPACFETYTATVIAPDHLLSGHFNDVLRTAVCVLGTPGLRAQFEGVLLQLVREAECGSQNRLFVNEERHVLTMRISDLYSLVPFAAEAFALVIRAIPGSAIDTSPLKRVLQVLRTAAALIHCMWTSRELCLEDDAGEGTAADVERRTLQARVRHNDSVRSTFVSHMQSLSDMWRLDEADANAMLDDNGQVLVGGSFPSALRARYDSVQETDCPNTHRLRELYVQHMLMWSHASWLSELSLKCAHQRVKRIQKHSNNHGEQHLAMRAIRFNDWQGRILSCVRQSEGSEPIADVDYGVRVLGGKRALREHLAGTLGDAHATDVRRLLDVNGAVVHELCEQGHEVVNMHNAHRSVYKVAVDATCPFILHDGNAYHDTIRALLYSCNIRRESTGAMRIFGAVLRFCYCRQRRMRVRIGDVFVLRGGRAEYVDGITGVDECTLYLRALAFAQLASDDMSCIAVVESLHVERVENELRGTAAFPRHFRLLIVRATTVVWRSVHSCVHEACTVHEKPTLRSGYVGHKRRTTSGDVYRVLGWAAGFPLRSG